METPRPLVPPAAAAGLPWHAHVRTYDLNTDINGSPFNWVDLLTTLRAANPGNTALLLKDEPPPSRFNELAGVADELKQRFPDALIYGNLSSSTILGQHTDDFIRIVDPDAIMYDKYPFFDGGGLDGRYWDALKAIRSAGLAHHIPYFAFIQSFGGSQGWRVPSESDLRFQLYTHLTAGFTGFSYFVYGDSAWEPGLVDVPGVPSSLYAPASIVNHELLNLAKHFKHSDRIDLRFVPGGLPHAPHLPMFDPSVQPQLHLTRIRVNNPTDLAHVGVYGSFRHDSGHDSFMVTNTFHGKDQSAQATALNFTIDFDNTVDVVYWLNATAGSQEAIGLSDHQLTVNLLGGTGHLYSLTPFPDIDLGIRPSIGSLSDGSDPVILGEPVILTAMGVSDSDGSVVKANFYRNSNGNGRLELGTDELLGTDRSATGGWSIIASTAAFPLGEHLYFASVEDDGGLVSNVASTTGEVVPVPGDVNFAVPDGRQLVQSLYSVSPADDDLRQMSPFDGSTLSTVSIKLPGRTIKGATGLAAHPASGQLYALLKLADQAGRELATIDPVSGATITVGDTGHEFVDMTFDDDGTLYAVTGDAATVPETLFELNPADATATQITPLGNGSAGEAIAFNPDDGQIYHASGSGRPNTQEVFETINRDTLQVDGVALTGSDYSKAMSLAYSEDHDLFFTVDSDQNLYTITSVGQVNHVGMVTHRSKGISFVPNWPILRYDPRQENNGTFAVEKNGESLRLRGNIWTALELPYEVTPNTVLRFYFASSAQGEVHGIGLDNDLFNTASYRFTVYGTQQSDRGHKNFQDYDNVAPGEKHYEIPVGDFFPVR